MRINAMTRSIFAAGLLKMLMLYSVILTLTTSCEREPILHLHRGDPVEFCVVDLDIDVVWDYSLVYGTYYDWRAEWFYGDDAELFGGTGEAAIGYHKPSAFELRRYYTDDQPFAPHTHRPDEHTFEGYRYTDDYNYGFYDVLVWNYIFPSGDDDAISIIIDERTSLDSVYASTNKTPRYVTVPNKATATRTHYQPEELFSAYTQAIDIDRNHTGFEWDPDRERWVKHLEATLYPLTYIYLTQVILHHNNGRIVAVDGNADLSGMASSTNVNSGYTGSEPVAVNYNCHMKQHINMNGEDVDIVGGRLLTFGMCNHNNYIVTRGPIPDHQDADRHYIDCTFIFNNGAEKTMSFDVTDQVRTRFKGGVLTVHIDVDDIEIPGKTGGSGFDAVVEEEEEVIKEIEM